MDRPMAKKGDRITFKPEYREEGDEKFEFIAMEDELAERRSLKVTVLGTGLFLNPIQTIDVQSIETVTPTQHSQQER